MVLDDEPVALADFGHRRRGAELGLLHRAARDADEMVVMARLAGDEAAAVEPPHAAVGLEQGERSVHGREADRAARLTGGGPELLGGEGMSPVRDERAQQLPLAGVPASARSLLKTLLILN